MPSDWSGHDTLQFDVYHAGDQIAKVEVMVGDISWTQPGKQTYWNRYNQVFSLIPGSNTITIAVDGMFRGEPATRNRDIAENINPAEIVQMNLWFKGVAGTPLFLDACRLTRAGENGFDLNMAHGQVGKKQKEALLFDFETLRDLAAWEIRAGAPPKLTNAFAVTGKKSLRISGDNLLACTAFPADWSTYDELVIPFHNPSQHIGKMEIMIGDIDWTQKQTYWNRFNAVYVIPPGESEIRIPVHSMYRGEAASRNRDLKSNLNPKEIVQVNLRGLGKAAHHMFVDGIKLVSNQTTQPDVWAFDFGPEQQAVWPGFLPVSWNTEYNPTQGYGLERSQAKSKFAGDTTFPSKLLGDYLWIQQGDFRLDVPNGNYACYVFFEDAGYWAMEQARFGVRTITVEGEQQSIEDRRNQSPLDEYYYRFSNSEPFPAKDAMRNYVTQIYAPKYVETTVNDGQLNIEIWSDARYGAKVSSIIVTRKDNDQVGKWVEQLMEKNLAELKSRAALIPHKPMENPSWLDESIHLFQASIEHPLLYTTIPEKPVTSFKTQTLVGAKRETVSFSMALRSLAQHDKVHLRLQGALPSKVSVVRHIMKRTYSDLTCRIVPWYLQQTNRFMLESNLTRQIAVHITIPEEVPQGTYAHQLEIVNDKNVLATIPLDIRVLDITLPDAPLAIAAFGMPTDSFPLFADVGFTTFSGGGGLVIKGFDEQQQPMIDFSNTDARMQKAREVGFSYPVLDYGGPISFLGMRYHEVQQYMKTIGDAAQLTAEEALARIDKAIEAHAQEQNWLPYTLCLADEPRFENEIQGILSSANWLRKHAPNLKTVGYYALPADPEAPINQLTKALNLSVTKGYSETRLQELMQLGNEAGLYSLGRHRYVFGPLLWAHWQRGITSYIQWHAFIVHGYQFFDLDGREPDMGLVCKTPAGFMPTLDLENIRQGITDLRYLTLLTRMEDAASKALLNELKDHIDIHARTPKKEIDLQQLRQRIRTLLIEQ